MNTHAECDALWERALSVNPMQLSEEEREIVQLIAESHDTKSIMKILNRAESTVTTHYQGICKKLGLDGFNKALITRWAAAKHIIHIEPAMPITLQHLHD